MAVTEIDGKSRRIARPLLPFAKVPRWLLLGATVLYIGVPLFATLLYSLATVWTDTFLPDGYTLSHWQRALSDPRILDALVRSLTLAALSVVIGVILVVPAAFWTHVRNKRLKTPIELAAAIPFCLPILVIAFGELQLAGDLVPELQGTFLLLLIGHTAVCFPFIYWSVDGALASARVETLTEAAETCGSPVWRTLLRVVVPNIKSGIAAGGVLAFAFSLGEFALVQVLAGSAYETVPLWSAQAFTELKGDFNGLAVVTVLMFTILFVISATILLALKGQGVGSFGRTETERGASHGSG